MHIGGVGEHFAHEALARLEVRCDAVIEQVLPVAVAVDLQPGVRAHGVDVAAAETVRGANVEHTAQEVDAFAVQRPQPDVAVRK